VILLTFEGYHQSRVGYNGGWMNINITREIYERLKKDHFPVEVMWSDIDYMYNVMDFVFDPVRYPVSEVKDFVNELHNDGARYVIIADPSIAIRSGYLPYDTGTFL
jgi:alpha-glucosidase (family GH31 glycosyl hydrolase)